MDQQGRVSKFSFEQFFCESAEKFVGEPISVSLVSGIEKCYASEGYVTIFCRNFFVSQYRKTLQGNPSVLCFGKFLVAIEFVDEQGGVSNYSFEKFLSHSAEFLIGEPISVSLISGIEKCYDSERYVTIFCRIFLVSQYRKTLQRNPSVLCFGKFLVAIEFMDEQGGVSKYSFEKILSHSAEFLIGEPISVSLVSSIEKSYASERYVTIFFRIFFCLAVPENIAGEPFCAVFRKISCSD